MSDPFAIQIPTSTSPVHERPGKHWGAHADGHEIDDFFVTPESRRPYLGVSANPRIMRLATLVLCFIFGIFLVRVAYLQVIRGNYYRGLAEGNRIRLVAIAPARGLMFDRAGTPLVQAVPQFVLAVRPADLPSDESTRETLEELGEVVGEEALAEVKSAPTSSRWIPIREDLSHEEAVMFTAQFADTRAVQVQTVTRRTYRTDIAPSLSHVLGYIGRLSEDDLFREDAALPGDAVIGKAGLEAAYESTLRGTYGRKHIEVDALGREKEIIAKEDPQDGSGIVLGLDLGLQEVAERALGRHLGAADRTRGAVVALDPATGEVRALVSLPTFDANEFNAGLSTEAFTALSNDPDRPLFPRAVVGTYPSGSIIKPLVAVAALSEGIITPQTTILSTGGVRISQWFFPDWKAGGHGPTDVYKAIAESVNTFFYYIGGGHNSFDGLGPEKLAIWARRFGLGVPTGIDLPGDAAGLVPTADWKERERGEEWYIGDTYHFAIGQGDVLVSPLQMAVVTATIANGGTRFAPHLVHAIRTETGDEQVVPPAVVEQNFIDGAAVRVVRDAMRQAVTYGSAQALNDLEVSVAGKTGTAQWSAEQPPHAWFTGFAPYRNPELVLVVLVEEGGEGSRAAVPIAREVFAWYFSEENGNR